MQNLTHFELVKVADIARETHENCEHLDTLLSEYLTSWTDYTLADNATPTQLKAWMKFDEDRKRLLGFLFPDKRQD
jgi:hypothetical protein